MPKSNFILFFIKAANIVSGTDKEGTVEGIKNNVQIRGANFWILFCGAFLASIGLDTNSAAVIIGAMLISPLMSPILGIGLGIAINDKNLILDSSKNFALAVTLSLVTSLIYFTFTPLGNTTSELLARTSPTLLDAAVAFIGGVAGIVAGSRKEKTNAIPGVAISTALMPPLCTAGFGLATGSMKIFLGAFYLFFLNAVLISLSTFFIVRLLKFPYVEFVDKQKKIRLHRWIVVITFLALIPSGIILLSVVESAKFDKDISSFVKRNFSYASRDVLNWDKFNTDSLKMIKVYYAGESLDSSENKKIIDDFNNLGYNNFKLNIVQVSLSNAERQNIMEGKAFELVERDIINQRVQESQSKEIDSLKSLLSRQKDSIFLIKLNYELKNRHPEINYLVYHPSASILSDSLNVIGFPSIIINYQKRTNKKNKEILHNEIDSLIKNFTGRDSVLIYDVQ